MRPIKRIGLIANPEKPRWKANLSRAVQLIAKANRIPVAPQLDAVPKGSLREAFDHHLIVPIRDRVSATRSVATLTATTDVGGLAAPPGFEPSSLGPQPAKTTISPQKTSPSNCNRTFIKNGSAQFSHLATAPMRHRKGQIQPRSNAIRPCRSPDSSG